MTRRLLSPMAGLTTLLLLAATTLSATPAAACSPAPGYDFSDAAQVKRADAVFTGVVVSVSGDEAGQRATIRVEKVEKGKPGTTVTVTSPSHSCGVRFTAGQRWRIMGRSRPDGSFATDSLAGSHLATADGKPPEPRPAPDFRP